MKWINLLIFLLEEPGSAVNFQMMCFLSLCSQGYPFGRLISWSHFLLTSAKLLDQ